MIAAARSYHPPLWVLVLLAVAAAVPVSEIAVAIVHYLATLMLKPCVQPKMDFKEGIPADCRTMVVMPTLLSSKSGLQTLLDRLEIHFLANPDPNLSFALLTDYSDAPSARCPRILRYWKRRLPVFKS